jgi:multiple sugar transport system substrate-binding protein
VGLGFFERPMDRRRFLVRGAVGAGALALAACGGDAVSGAARSVGQSGGNVSLSFSSWNTTGSLRSFRSFADRYHAAHPGVDVTLQVTPGTFFDEWFGARLRDSNAPDILRMQYQQAGRYIKSGGIVNIAPYLPPGFGDAYLPTFWDSISYRGGVYGLPHHTDTFAIYYRTDIMQQIGVTPPDTLNNAWHWDEFMSIARKVKALTGKYAVSIGWTGPSTAYRWLPLLYMHGGQLLADDGRTPAIDSPQGVAALAWTQNLYKEGLVPPDNNVKGSALIYARQLFTAGTVGLMLNSDNQLVNLQTEMKDNQWGVTYMMRDAGKASDLGGNILAVTRDCENVKAAVDFLLFVCSPENTLAFVTDNNYIPTLKALSSRALPYPYRPELMQRFVEQSTTVPAAMAKVETSFPFGNINLMLADQLDTMFTTEQTPAQTATGIATALKTLARA